MGRRSRKTSSAGKQSLSLSDPEGGEAPRGRRSLVIVFIVLTTAGAVYWLSSPSDPQESGPQGASPNMSALPASGNAPDERSSDVAAPTDNGWDTEAFGEQASTQLKAIGKLIALEAWNGSKSKNSSLADDAFSSAPLRPASLREVHSDDSCTVHRAESLDEPSKSSGLSLDEAIRELVKPFVGATDVRVKFKLFEVDLDDLDATTSAYYQAAGRFEKGAVQQSATWRCRWRRSSEEELPRLVSIEVQEYEEVVNKSETGVWFSDCTQAVLESNQSWRSQLVYGLDHWRKRLPTAGGIDFSGHYGLAIGDVNGDGLEDLYLCRPGGLPNKLLVQSANGTVKDVSREAGVDWLDVTQSALLIDLDNDGDQDLVTTIGWGVIVQSNDGKGRFTREVTLPVITSNMSLVAADYDLDGDLDFYICAYEQLDSKTPVPYHDANNGGANHLFRNDGNWRFTDVTAEVGLNENNSRFSFAATWEDFDRDGDPDLYVANDYGRNNLYRNDKGTFHDIAATAGIEDLAAGMSVTWGDYNGDGLLDLYVSNMFSSAGNRIAYQRQFKPGVDESIRTQFQRHARGNSLFENRGDGTFRDVSMEAHVTMGRWAWGSNFLDINNDGRDDLFVANGYVTQEDTGDL
jgi:hypothetical protein